MAQEFENNHGITKGLGLPLARQADAKYLFNNTNLENMKSVRGIINSLKKNN